MVTAKQLADDSAEKFAIETMGKVCLAYRGNSVGAVRGHLASLRNEAERTGDATIRFAADETAALLAMMQE